MESWIIILVILLYLMLLFGIAYFVDFKLQKKSLVNNAYIYALSLAVYCTAWTFFGSLGRAAKNGVDFLTTYLGPTIVMLLALPLLRKLIRISKTQRITSLADLASTRYGKNFTIAVVVTLLMVFGIIPYIALQIKAIVMGLSVITGKSIQDISILEFFKDPAFYITFALGAFVILFGARSDASEKHDGLMAAIAFESVIKLAAYLTAGVFIVYVVFDGFTDIFAQAASQANLRSLFTLETDGSYITWTSMMILAMSAIIFLPRQFQVLVVENNDEKHLVTATWLFPLYLLVINIFVLPIMFSGKLLFGNTVEAETFILAIPLYFDQTNLGLFIFLGGFSAAASMIVIETIALSTMLSNNIAMPVLLSVNKFSFSESGSVSRNVLNIRRLCIILICLAAYVFDKLVAQKISLVSIGLISFAAVIQLAPAVIGGLYWKQGSRKGAIAGIVTGFLLWFYILIVPSLANANLINESVVTNGPFNIGFLRPTEFLGLTNFDSISLTLFWSLFFNAGLYILISLRANKSNQEIYYGELFVDIFKHTSTNETKVVWHGTANLPDLLTLLSNFLGEERARRLVNAFATRNNIRLDTKKADPALVAYAERILSGVIGSASARIMVHSVVQEEELRVGEVMNMLRESQQILELNKELRKKSTELFKATEQLTKTNQLLKELDQQKDEFLYTVTHELRTPLTSIRAMSEIVHDHPDMDPSERNHFLESIIKETNRLNHLITQVLNLERYESGKQKLNLLSVNLAELLDEVNDTLKPLANERGVQLSYQLPDSMILVQCDKDLIYQVLINLISNAIKFSPEGKGHVRIGAHYNYNEWELSVADNGKGISEEIHELIFDKFFQAKNQTLRKPEGSGLGLAICKKIVEMHGGKISVKSQEGMGATFIFTLPG